MSRDRAIEGCQQLVQEIIARQQAYRAAKPKIRLWGEDEYELVCVNGHDRCYEGPFEGCPYCERRKLNDEAQLDHDDYLTELGITNADYREWTHG